MRKAHDCTASSLTTSPLCVSSMTMCQCLDSLNMWTTVCVLLDICKLFKFRQVNVHKPLNICLVHHLCRNGEVLYEIPANSFAPPDFAASPSNMFLPK